MTAASPGGARPPAAAARPAWDVLLSVLGLAVWAGHFTAIYAASALACERGLARAEPLGPPWVAAVVGAATLAAVALLGLILRATLSGLPRPLYESGETEPRFSLWFAAATTVLAAVAVLFQATPALFLPPCG